MRTILNVGTLPQGGYNKDSYKNILTGTSDRNEYIPVYAIGSHELIVFKDTDIKVMEYTMPNTNVGGLYVRLYADLVRTLKNTVRPVKYIFKIQGNTHNLYIDRGLLYTETGEILLCLAINRDYLMALQKDDFVKGNLDSTKFVLFLSNELDSPIYKNLKKKLDTLYINEAKLLDLDIIISNRIVNWVFKNNVEPLKFKSVVKMNKHLKDEVPMRILDM